MDEHHPLKTLLNIHLASDTSAVLHLPFVLDALVPDSLAPSPHLSKWTARIQSLLRSKEPAGRWAGLTLAQKTGILSNTLLLENGQSWVGVALPLLSKNESTVVLKASIRLLRTIFTHSYEASEFRRQVATPNIPKLVATLISLGEQTGDTELKAVAISTLVNLIPLYPTLHKPSYSALSNFALLFLDGHPHTPVPLEVLSAASRLYCTIHVTGGKVGASNLWRKTLDETLGFGTNAFWSLRTTFSEGAPANISSPRNQDPIVSVPLYFDRLKCAITILDDLFGATVYRPVQIPLGATVRFAFQLLKSTASPKKDGFVDPTTHMLEVTAVPKIQELGCSLVVSFVKWLDHHLQPYVTQLTVVLAVHLESPSTGEHRHILLHTLKSLLRHYPSYSSLIATRLMKAVLPFVSKILAGSDSASEACVSGPAHSRGKRNKNRTRMHEGDELFLTRPIVCPTSIDGKVLLIALEVVRLLLREPHLSASMQSISVRVLISALLVMDRIPPAILSPDPTLHRDVLSKLHDISTEFASGTSDTLSKSLPLIVDALSRGSNNTESQRQLDSLLHPRLPPLMRSVPLAQNLSLVFSEESQEERELRRSLGLYTNQDEIQQQGVDVRMNDSTIPPTQFSATVSTPEVAPSSVTPVPVRPLSLALQKPRSDFSGQKQPGLTPTLARETVEQSPPILFHPTAIESHKGQAIQPALKPFQAEASTSAPKAPIHSAPPLAEDEDDDMPAIDMNSDSDIG